MAVPHSGVPSPTIPPADGDVADLTANTLTVSGDSTLADVAADSLTLVTPLVATSVSIADAAGDFDATNVEAALAELQTDAEADAAALAAHDVDTTSVHGITDTANLTPDSLTTALATVDAARFKGEPTFDVRAFGATGDGVTDETTACQAAIDAAVAAGGGIIHFTRGTYLLNTVTVSDISWVLEVTADNIWFELDEGAELKTTENASIVFFAGPAKDGLGFTDWVANRFYPNLTVHTLTGTYAKGATSITLNTAGEAANYAAGDLILIRTGQLIDASLFQPDGEINEVVTSTPGTGVITLKHPLAKPYAQEYFISGTTGKTSTDVTANLAPYGISNVTDVTLRNVGIRGRGKITAESLTTQNPFAAYQCVGFGVEGVTISTSRNAMGPYFLRDFWFTGLTIDHMATGAWWCIPLGATCQTDGVARDIKVSAVGVAFLHIHEGGARLTADNVRIRNRGTSGSQSLVSIKARGYDIKVLNGVYHGKGSASVVLADETVIGGVLLDGNYVSAASAGAGAVRLGGPNQKWGPNNVVELGVVEIRPASTNAVVGPLAPITMESIANWVSDDNQNPTIGILPNGSFVTSVKMQVREAFNSDGSDLLSVGWDSNNATMAAATDVSTTGIKTIAATGFWGYRGAENIVEAYYVNGGSEPTTGRALVVVEFYRVPFEVS